MVGWEIERKFLVNLNLWKTTQPGTPFSQGYIPTGPGRTVRVRIEGKEGRLTIKGPPQGLTRAEFEYPIPAEDARQMLDTLCEHPLVEKVRHRVRVGRHIWEVDVFDGLNQGLVLAEIELDREEEAFERPEWLGAEVSHDPRYANSQLAKVPYTTW
jgi:CYTH domain-containing protein